MPSCARSRASSGPIELGIPGHPLVSPPCTSGWVAQIASVDSTSEFARASVVEQLDVTGTSYTYAPDSCSTFDRGGNRYSVFLGPFTTKADAETACTQSGDEDCFARQLQYPLARVPTALAPSPTLDAALDVSYQIWLMPGRVVVI